MSDLAERRRVQNRIAPRSYHEKLKKHLQNLAKRANAPQNDSSNERKEQPQINYQTIGIEEGPRTSSWIKTSNRIATTVSHMSPTRSAVESLSSTSPTRQLASPISSLGNSSHATEYESSASSDLDDEINDSDCSTLQPFMDLILEELLLGFFRDQSPAEGCHESEHTEDAHGSPANEGQLDTVTYSSSIRVSSKRKRQEGEDENSEDGDRRDEKRPAKKSPPQFFYWDAKHILGMSFLEVEAAVISKMLPINPQGCFSSKAASATLS
ncbi:hypothetical protein GGR53DRAFT_469678 [Hypoxylon sp. FL1150]|nr:hypothetical protein GGR53DRAFT_469678 [Hypoxylon sp. FL1150]